MKESTKKKIEEAIAEIKELGGLNDKEMRKIINKLKKALKEDIIPPK